MGAAETVTCSWAPAIETEFDFGGAADVDVQLRRYFGRHAWSYHAGGVVPGREQGEGEAAFGVAGRAVAGGRSPMFTMTMDAWATRPPAESKTVPRIDPVAESCAAGRRHRKEQRVEEREDESARVVNIGPPLSAECSERTIGTRYRTRGG